MSRTTGFVVASVLFAVLAVANTQSQAPASPGSRDIMPELLAEVRGLRAAIEQMTSSASRVQLSLGRLQLQEQRLNTANGRLAEIRVQLAGSQRRAVELQEQVANLESMLSGQSEMPKPDPNMTAEHVRRMLTMEMQSTQREAGKVNADVQRLTSEENALANDVSAEQARWADLSQRLDDLERSLRPAK